MQSIIMHLDMNSYFATAEQQDHPQYRGKPLGVCEHLGGIIIAASIEAKKWGIKTGTPVWEARKLYPKIILTKTHPDRYRFHIKNVLKIAADYTAFVEQASIDEMYLDVTKACNVKVISGQCLVSSDPFGEAVNIAREIKRRMKLEAGDYLKCSIGIAENKLVAKIASDLQKPDGLVVIKPFFPVIPSEQEYISNSAREESLKHGIAGSHSLRDPSRESAGARDGTAEEALLLSKDDLYRRLKLTDIPGIARRQEKNLNKLGIKTLLELKNYPLSLLVARFGINGYHLHKMGQLEASWKPDVEKDEGIKSIGHMYTLPIEFREKKFFVPVLYKLCEMVARRLRKQNLTGNSIHFFVRDRNYKVFGESKKLGFYLYDGREIFFQCMRVFQNFNMQPGEFKLIGVTVAGLKPQTNQLSLFGDEERLKRITKSLDKINLKYGDFTVCRVPVLGAKGAFADSIGFGRIKEK